MRSEFFNRLLDSTKKMADDAIDSAAKNTSDKASGAVTDMMGESTTGMATDVAKDAAKKASGMAPGQG